MDVGENDVKRPEFAIAIFGFLTAFVWEVWQMPFFDKGGASPLEKTFGCTVASIGDAGIMVLSYMAGTWASGDRNWLCALPKKGVAAYLLTGLAITIAIEHVATRLPITIGWRYSDIMPTLFGVGLVPVVMWIIIPLLTLWLSRWMLR